MLNNQENKLNLPKYISIIIVIIALIVVLFIIYKYQIEGEAIPPFKISKLMVVSTAKTENLQLVEDTYTADLIQNNDIKILIEKNPDYKKEAIIRKITINNIQINPKETNGKIELYRSVNGTYKYVEKYRINESIEYYGAQETNVTDENVQIANQGGIIDISAIIRDIGQIQYSENEAINVDGKLLAETGIEHISFELKFDLIIELENNVKLKTKLKIELPAGNILVNGVETTEQTDLNSVFKRI